MRVVIQRVSFAKLTIDEKIYSEIENGLLVLIGIEEEDTEEDIEYLAGKITKLRIFNDQNGVMNLSVNDINGEIMAVSQFTLHALTKKGNRPSYIRACKPEKAIPLYEVFVEKLRSYNNNKVKTGVFGADMKIQLCNEGPVTIWIDSKNKE
ncbi:D-aminoacyl-tRNA deacylase [Capnocytophaga catalasegens]|uniref:D-aminoacyl-tRNA deacylase n=1 Tax=Capnocytophaga catalasegens TaxID=1004260 RepID=A0AAV5AVR6_9FLAO|nr:D-aminoacyl-tRNA deacylase [Capnocytophaga catalasegens]GIZ16222.1 D-aminoacyl-tRNA deacylase [Capnocytophaga catalasegens]GJM49450.1 D-aminoacyl-tRNA deacylase [Capnocytophaga catalasegens]GJM53644.1 D-aminoacyl-tRNA deacylase [Capnocytophaga catalasegens]